MSHEKKKVRQEFKKSVFARDRYRCKKCGYTPPRDKAEDELDAHHITNRNLFPNGGYVKENGITLCKKECHLKAEKGEPGFEAELLYRLIGSSRKLAEIKDASCK